MGIIVVDLCSVVGNLLNNAIQGAMDAPEGKRYITFKADVELNNDIYIVVSNSFDGVVKKENGKYFTTKSNGHGIGLESIQTTVNKYNGYVKFYNDNVVVFNQLVGAFPSNIVAFFWRYKRKEFHNNEKKEMYQILNEK